MPTYNLGYPQPEYDIPYASDSSEKKGKKPEPKTYFPEFTIRGEAAKKLMRKGIAAGDEIEVTMKLKVVGTQDREKSESRPYMDHGCSVEFSAHELTCDHSSEEKEESAEEAIENYRKSKGK